MGSGAATPAAQDAARALRQLLQSFQRHGPQTELLPAVRQAVVALRVRTVDRRYRFDFTENYVLLLGQDLNYRPEILSAAMMQDPDLWVNGTLHHISGATLHKGRMLKRCFLKLCEILSSGENDVGVLMCSQLLRALSVFESHWAQYEEAYIKELIHIESLARQPLEKAVDLELSLLTLEKDGDLDTSRASRVSGTSGTHSRGERGSDQLLAPTPRAPRPRSSTSLSLPRARCEAPPRAAPEARDRPQGRWSCELMDLAKSAAQRHSTRAKLLSELVLRVSELNACANTRGKGRSDMTVEVLEAAADLLLEAQGGAREALARGVLEGFLRVRHYLSEVSTRMLWIDPQLSSNEDLEVALTDWENAWELGSTFLLKPELSRALCGIASDVAKACALEESLAEFIENQDAELFLILPRLVLLSGLRHEHHMALPAWLLPELDLSCSGAAESKRKLLDYLSQLESPWQSLTVEAIRGFQDGPGVVMLELEALSMQMQRKEPRKWNRCSAQLLLCIAAERL